MKKKLKSYSFWMSVSAGVVLVLNNIGKVFGFVVESEAVTQIIDSVCGVLILFGVITIPKDEKQNGAHSENVADQLDCDAEKIIDDFETEMSNEKASAENNEKQKLASIKAITNKTKKRK